MKQIWSDETGASTAEYAILTLAAVGFAGLLLAVLRSPEVRQMLLDLVRSALTGTGST
jgi:Flp pilus assembly pilin Flp